MKQALVHLAATAALLTAAQSAEAARLPSRPAKTCATPASSEEVAHVIRAFFAALTTDDGAAVGRLTTPNFYAYDVGKRYSGPELLKVIAEAHKSGRIMQWNIGAVDARIDCKLAFASWENRGAVGAEGRMQARAWLESALLVRHGGRWVIDFLHSTPKDPRN